jgi:hypothetical protein
MGKALMDLFSSPEKTEHGQCQIRKRKANRTILLGPLFRSAVIPFPSGSLKLAQTRENIDFVLELFLLRAEIKLSRFCQEFVKKLSKGKRQAGRK